jgi:hypothetical protein
MKSVLVMMLLAVSAFAQEQPGTVAAACGPKEAFAVKLDQSQHTLAQPEPGRARVYFVQDIGAVNCLGGCGTKIGLDGAWAGANKQNSYFSVSVEPGEHHVCEPKPAILAAYSGPCALHSGSGEGVLLPHTTLFGERPALEY